ncbi:MAG: alpha/beta hydrolase family protein [Bacteroidota bacterium]|nr:esterase family protein [Candidatus Kapabacteria bacterium]MDW8219073.1 alpha/beta hydrolase family protein [Bacteroidota bacterium]
MIRYLFAAVLPAIGFWSTIQRVHAQALLVDSAYSQALGTTTAFSIIIPEYYDTVRRYPVLYLLHGWGGSHRDWATKTRLREYASWFDLIIAMPNAGNSWYVNSIAHPQHRYEQYIAGEFPAILAQRYAIDTSQQAIAGLSMGGYGAIMLALKYQHKYRVAASFSGALTMPRDLVQREQAYQSAQGKNGDVALLSLQEAFGKDPRSRARDTNSVFTLCKRASLLDSASKARLPYIYLATGIHDQLAHIVPGNREFRDSLYSFGLRYEYHETPGKHAWSYWDEALRAFLPRLIDITRWK